MGYALPTPTDFVSCSWQCHKDRNPPSSEPGTDYGCGYGSTVTAVDAGTVTYVKRDNSGAMGRVVEYLLDDGRETRTLHMSEVWVSVGQRLTRGQSVGLSGASGYGSDWYYGPHAHQTLWPGAAWAAPTIDFAVYVGEEPAPNPLEQDDEMIRIQGPTRGIALIGPGYFRHLANSDEVVASDAIISKHLDGTDNQFDLWKNVALTGTAATIPVTAEQVQAIAEKIAAEIDTVPAEVDYDAIAKAVNDDAAARMEA